MATAQRAVRVGGGKARPETPVAAYAAARCAANRTGLPDRLKGGIEALSGVALDHVRVHRNSGAPARLDALAFTRGSEIHLAPGQERHLPHETWHVVQQAQGRVRPTMALDGAAISDDAGLEAEAETMGARAMGASSATGAATGERAGAGIVAAARRAPSLMAAPVVSSPHRHADSDVAQRIGLTGTLSLVGGLIGTLVNPAVGRVVGGLVGAAVGGMIGIVGGYIYDKAYGKSAVPWIFYINPKDFDHALKLKDPGLMYDRDKSPGYQASMVKALEEELFGARLGGRIDYKEYERLHNRVTDHLKSDNVHYTSTLKSIRTRSSSEAQTEFPINDWNDDKLPPAKDLLEESIDLGEDGKLPMVLPFESKMPLSNKSAIQQDRKPSVTVFDPGTNDGQFSVRYSEEEGVRIVEAILNRYYIELDEAKRLKSSGAQEEARLDAIVKVIRALHVTHPFKDANGRLHVQLLLNRFLKEQGFPMSIMPREFGLGAFGGAFSIPELRKMVVKGFRSDRSTGTGESDEKKKEL